MSETMEKPRPLIIAGGSAKLALILTELGNTRAYTIIRSHGNKWRVHFEGDMKASTVKQVDGKYVIITD